MPVEERRFWVGGGEGTAAGRSSRCPYGASPAGGIFMSVAHAHRRAATTRAVLLCMAVAGAFLFRAAAETPDEQKARVQRIEDAVLAPCCYTEPVSRHQSEIAVKMRMEIAEWVAAGKTDQEILRVYVERYGAKVLVDPRTIPAGWIPWIPWLTLMVGTVMLLWLLKRRRSAPQPVMPSSRVEGQYLVETEDDIPPPQPGKRPHRA